MASKGNLRNIIRTKLEGNLKWSDWSPTSRVDSLTVLGLPISSQAKLVWHFLSDIKRDWQGDPNDGIAKATQREIADCTRLTLRYVNASIRELEMVEAIKPVRRGVYKLEFGKQAEANSVYTRPGKQSKINLGSTRKQNDSNNRAYKGNNLASNGWTGMEEGYVSQIDKELTTDDMNWIEKEMGGPYAESYSRKDKKKAALEITTISASELKTPDIVEELGL